VFKRLHPLPLSSAGKCEPSRRLSTRDEKSTQEEQTNCPPSSRWLEGGQFVCDLDPISWVYVIFRAKSSSTLYLGNLDLPQKQVEKEKSFMISSSYTEDDADPFFWVNSKSTFHWLAKNLNQRRDVSQKHFSWFLHRYKAKSPGRV